MPQMHLADAELKRLKKFATSGFAAIDTETTGLDASDEVLSVAVVDDAGNKLFYELVLPIRHTEWPGAERIHGISWEDVKDAPPLTFYASELRKLIERAPLVVGYNLDYDLEKLAASGLPLKPKATFDLMEEYAQAYGEWNDYFQDYKWEKLVNVAARYGYSYAAHDALQDAKATAYCYKRFIGDCKAAKPAGKFHSPKVMPGQASKVDKPKKPKSKMVTRIIGFFAILFAIGLLGNAGKLDAGGLLFYLTATILLAFWYFSRK